MILFYYFFKVSSVPNVIRIIFKKMTLGLWKNTRSTEQKSMHDKRETQRGSEIKYNTTFTLCFQITWSPKGHIAAGYGVTQPISHNINTKMYYQCVPPRSDWKLPSRMATFLCATNLAYFVREMILFTEQICRIDHLMIYELWWF